jgi:predicted permease
MEAWIRDLRFAARRLAGNPGTTLLAALSLALGLGFSTAAFSIVDAYLFRPLPVKDPSRLASVLARDTQQRLAPINWAEYEAIASRVPSLEGVFAQTRRGPHVKLADRDEFPLLAGVSDNYFDVLGVRAALGTVFHRGAGRDFTVVIADRFWRRALNGDPDVLGRRLIVNSRNLTIIGVLPPGFTGANRGLPVELFVPEQAYFGALDNAPVRLAARGDFELMGRLRAGATADLVRSQVSAVLAEVAREGRAWRPGNTAAVTMLMESSWKQSVTLGGVFLLTVGLILLIAASNVANLRLVDNQVRRRDTGIRLALGAGRLALLRQHGAESVLLALLGAVAGVVMAAWLVDLAPAFLYAGQRYRDFNIRLDGRGFWFAATGLAVVTAFTALIPLANAWRVGIVQSLQPATTGRNLRWLAVLVVFQMALTTALAGSAAQLFQTLANVAQIRPALDPERRMTLVQASLDRREGVAVRVQEIAAQLAAIPGVRQAAWARRVPLAGSGGGAMVPVQLPGQEEVTLRFNQISPNYFAATGALLLRGRPFSFADGEGAAPVILVSEAFVRRYYPGGGVLGAVIKAAGSERTIVGVVEDGPSNYLKQDPEPYLYFPFAQRPVTDPWFLIETGVDPASVMAPVRETLRRVAPDLVSPEILTLEQHLRHARHSERMASAVVGSLAGMGLLLAAAGLFGVTLFAVNRRTREFGIRAALGASSADLRTEVVGGALKLALWGIPLGWLLAWTFRESLKSFLHGVKPGEPWILGLAGLGVAGVAFVAALLPARRAARVDPSSALRYE